MDERVSFTRPSAERIASVVRAVEQARTPADGVQSRRPPTDARIPKVFRVATYSGAWSIGEMKTVTFKYQTSTPNTASVTNLFFPVSNTATGSRDCGIAKDGTSWFLIDVKLSTATAVFVKSTQSAVVFGTNATSQVSIISGLTTSVATFALAGGTASFLTAIQASLNTANCSISITNTTATVKIVSGTQTAATFSDLSTQRIMVVSLSSTQSISVLSSSFTATFLRLDV